MHAVGAEAMTELDSRVIQSDIGNFAAADLPLILTPFFSPVSRTFAAKALSSNHPQIAPAERCKATCTPAARPGLKAACVEQIMHGTVPLTVRAIINCFSSVFGY